MRPLTLCTGRFWEAQGRRWSAILVAGAGFSPGPRLGFATLQIVPKGGRETIRLIGLGLRVRDGDIRPFAVRILGRFWLAGRHGDPLTELRAELTDASFQVNWPAPAGLGRSRSRCRAARFPRIHEPVKGADILAMTPPALELLPPTPHRDDHDPFSPPRIGSDAPMHCGVGYRQAMI